MKFTQRTRGIVQAIAVVLSLAVPLVIAISSADARIGGGGSSGSPGPRTQANFRSGMGFGLGSGSAPLEIQPADYEAFERLLGEIQTAWSNEDVAALQHLSTPEMLSYFAKDLEENKARNDVNKTSN